MMKPRATGVLFEYWDTLRGTRRAPDRSDIEPRAIQACLADTFVLSFAPEEGHPFRIAGTALCAMFGAELTRTSFVRLWGVNERPAIRDLIGAVVENLEGVTASVTGRNGLAEQAELEMILLPLTSADGAGRVLGALTLPAAPYWLATRRLESLSLGEMRTAGHGGSVLNIRPSLRHITRNFHG